MRDFILLFVNGQQHRVEGSDAFLTLSNFLRNRLGLCGTKIVCSEGDCGSCSVLCAQCDVNGDSQALRYRPIDSCIRFVFQLDGCHVVTVEGMTNDVNGIKQNSQNCKLNSVQQAMIDCHGSQCGFCTPGFVVAMTGLLEENEQPDEDQWRRGLTGNLCRCTGYSPIIDAGLKCNANNTPPMNEYYSPSPIIAAVANAGQDEICIEVKENPDGSQTVCCPTSLEQVTHLLATHPNAKIVAGATDIGVQFNKGRCEADFWIDLNRVNELRAISIDNEFITVGACATWTEFDLATADIASQFHEIVSVFGSPQIRHVGTIGGNIINASPIADSIPFLMVSDTELVLTSKSGSRTVNINEFYQDYKKFDLQPGELLTQVRIRRPLADDQLRLYKISRRRDLDISSFTGAIKMQLDGDTIKNAAIALGAVGPVVLRLPITESFLTGKTLNDETMRLAGDLAVEEITPITDVRGGKEYRLQLTRNVLLKFAQQVQGELV